MLYKTRKAKCKKNHWERCTPVQSIYSGNSKQEEIQALDRKCKHEVVLHEHCCAGIYQHICCHNVPQCYAREHSLKEYCNRLENAVCFQSKLDGVHLCSILRHAGNSSCSLGTLLCQSCSVCCSETTCTVKYHCCSSATLLLLQTRQQMTNNSNNVVKSTIIKTAAG